MCDTQHRFGARCPLGHRPAQSFTLSQLMSSSIEFYCGLCNRRWVPSSDELNRARDFARFSREVVDVRGDRWTTGRS